MRLPLAILIVNYRTPKMVVDCLASLEPELAPIPGAQVIVLDNASGDGSAEHIGSAIAERGWGGWARLIPSDTNLGFAGGNNLILRQTDADRYLLLNPDTVVRPGAIGSMLRFMADHPKAGIVSPSIEDADGTVHQTAHVFPDPIGELPRTARTGFIARLFAGRLDRPLDPDKPTQQDWVSGAALMIRRKTLDEIGHMDEGFFLYFDDIDYCHRAKKAGWEVWYLPGPRILHFEGQATQIKAERTRRKHWWYDARRRFIVKAYGIIGLIVADVMWATGRAIFKLRRLFGLGGSTAGDPLHFSRDLLWGDLRALLTGRARVIDPPPRDPHGTPPKSTPVNGGAHG